MMVMSLLVPRARAVRRSSLAKRPLATNRWAGAGLLIPAALIAVLAAGCKGSSSTGSTPTTPTTPTTPVTGPAVTLTPSVLTFPLQTTVSTSDPQTSTLSNSGTEDLVITGVATSGSFTETDNCITTLPPGGTCTITVAFVPTVIGTSGTVTITNNASTSPQTLTLAGPNVNAPSDQLSPLSLSYGSQRVGTSSASQLVTLSSPFNGLAAPLTISSITVSGDFAITNSTCGGSLTSGTSCQIAIAFTPSAPGVRSGLLAVFDNAATSQRGVTLSGVGQ
jgi:hypothetical protein